MPEIRTEFLFTLVLEVDVLDLGNTPQGGRRIARLRTGRFEGPKLRGTVLPGGGGWSLLRRDGVLEINKAASTQGRRRRPRAGRASTQQHPRARRPR